MALREGAREQDREAECRRNAHQIKRFGAVFQIVLHGGEHTVVRATLMGCVAQVRVESSIVEQLGRCGADPFAGIGLAVSFRDALRGVIQIASPIGPRHVVQHDEGQRLLPLAAARLDQLQLVKHRVPVVVAVDEHGIEPFDVRERVETDAVVKNKPLAMELLPGRHVEAWCWVDGVDDCASAFGKLQQAACRFAVLRAHLDDALRSERFEQRTNHVGPEREHGSSMRGPQGEYNRGAVSFDLFDARRAHLLGVPHELLAYQRWLDEQTAPDGPRDYLFSDDKPRFEPRKDDVVVPLPGLEVTRHKGGARFRGSGGVELVVRGASVEQAKRVLASLDGSRCLLEARWQADVGDAAFARLLRATFGKVLFAPHAVEALEAEVSGAEIVRFPGSPYAIERPYWSNMVDVRQRAVARADALQDHVAFVDLLRELHLLTLLGRSLESYYKPASPVAERTVAPGALFRSAVRLLETPRGVIFLDGPRVKIPLLGGEGYHEVLYRSLGDEAALGERCFQRDDVPWGRVVLARGEGDDEVAPWFCPPRPITHTHLEHLRVTLAAGWEHGAVEQLARFHQAWVRLHPFHCANQSLAMNLVNAALTRSHAAGIPHLILDHLALRLSEQAYIEVFARAVTAFVVAGEPAARLTQLSERKRRSFDLIRKLSAASGDTDQLLADDPQAAGWALIR